MGNESPSYNFTTHPSVGAFAVGPREFLANNPQHGTIKATPVEAGFVCVGAICFHPPSFETKKPPRVLLIKRSAADSLPNRWEIPGGGCDDDDSSVLHSVARELYEEAGLVAASIGPQVGPGYLFYTRQLNVVCKFTFLVEVAPPTTRDGEARPAVDQDYEVVLDPVEHQDYVWATEDEVRAGRTAEKELEFTFPEQKSTILDAFAVKVASS